MIQTLKQKLVQTLRWSEQYTKTDMVYLAKGSFWTWLGKGTQIITGTAMAVAFANLLPKEVYGNYKYILSVANMLGAFALLGMDSSVKRSVAKGLEGSLKQALQITARWSLLIIGAAVSIAAYYFWQGNILLASGMLLVAFFQPIIKTSKLYEAHLVGKKMFRTQSLYLVMWEILQVTLMIGALLFTQNAVVLILILFAINALLAGFYLWQTLRKYVGNSDTVEETISYGKHLSIIRYISEVAKYLDSVLIFQILGAVPTAIYSFALLPSQKLLNLPQSLSYIILPKFSNRSWRKIKKSIGRKALLWLGVAAIFTLCFILLLPTLFNIFFPEYMEAVKYAQAIALVLLLTPEILFSEALVAHAKKRILYAVNISSNLLKITLLIALLPIYGIWGAVFALLIFYLFRLIAKILLFYRPEFVGSGSTQ